MATTDEAPPQEHRGGLSVSEEQAAVVDHVLDNPFTVVDAGAGAGKTRTTVASAFEVLARNPQATLDQFVLITFTNKAADELRRRLEDTLAELEAGAADAAERQRWVHCRERLPGAYVGTIHGFCSQILKTFGYGALVARLSDVDYSRRLLHDALREVLEGVFPEPDHPLQRTLCRTWRVYNLQRLILDVYEDQRNRGLNPARVAEATAGRPADEGHDFRAALAEAVRKVHEAYTHKKQAENKLDATDLLWEAARVLEGDDGPAIARNLSRRYRYLFIDEFQDTDALQKRILDCLQPHLAATMVVGDAKQSIYGFRGAGLSLVDLADEKGVDVLRLSISRRPTEQLLHAYNALFASMSKPNPLFGAGARRYPELGHPLKPHLGTIRATTVIPPLTLVDSGAREDREARILHLALAIRKLIGKPLDVGPGKQRPVEAGDIAVLFRGNEALGEYEPRLRALLVGDGIEVRRESGSGFYRRPEVIGVYRLLRLLLDYPSDIALALALETPYLADVDLADTLTSYLWYGRKQGHELTDRFEAKYAERAALFRRLRSALRTDTVPELLGRMDELLGLWEYHRRRSDTAGEDALERLREVARLLGRSEQALTAGVFAEHLSGCILSDAEGPEEVPAGEEERRPPYVRLMTVHAAKGLEFPVVLLPEVQAPVGGRGLSRFVQDEEDGLDVRLGDLRGVLQTESAAFGGRLRTDQAAALFEEMRIFYVAITRAQNHVVLIGADADPAEVHKPGDRNYSWQDEVLAAWPELARRGAKKTGD